MIDIFSVSKMNPESKLQCKNLYVKKLLFSFQFSFDIIGCLWKFMFMSNFVLKTLYIIFFLIWGGGGVAQDFFIVCY